MKSVKTSTRKASFVPRLEALEDRLVPSVTFNENTSTHLLTIKAASGQNNTVAITNDGNGGLSITADGTTRTFSGITEVDVNTYDGADTVTYNQGTSAGEKDVTRSFLLSVDLGSNASGTDHFTANVFGDVGFFSNGSWQARELAFLIYGGDGADRIDLNLNHDVDVRPGSDLAIHLYGGNGNDNITVDHDGEVDGFVYLQAAGENDNDSVAVNLHLDFSSSGFVMGGDGGAARVRGDLGDDTLTFAIREDSGSTASVDAVIDGGFGWGWPDNDTGSHTTNVRSAYLEHDFSIQ